jgi:hypothetical protein
VSYFHLTLKSSNAKTGPIPVSTTSGDTCPKSCGQYSTCYAKSGPLALHWNAVTGGERGTTLDTFCASIAALPDGQLWRHNQSGDLPGQDGTIDKASMLQLVAANKGKRGFTYTHKPMDSESNRDLVRFANQSGFVVNLSADTIAEADAKKALGIAPVAVVLPHDATHGGITPAGNRVVLCPASMRDDVTCASCKLCSWADRQVIIGFPAHGSKKKQVKSDFVVLA